jgi:hypothetical protein
MNSKIGFKVFFSILFLICASSFSQGGLSLYTDFGKNNVSEGLFSKTVLTGSFRLNKTILFAGIQSDLRNNLHKGLSGYTFSASRILIDRKTKLMIKGYGIITNPSKIVMESDLGLLIRMSHSRFNMEIGSDFRTYNLRQKAVSDNIYPRDATKIREIYNIVYLFNYNLKPNDDTWNVGLTITNIDHFIINQETNPVLNLSGKYKLRLPITLYAEAWYKYAGVTNLELNKFGYFFRTGIIWNIN